MKAWPPLLLAALGGCAAAPPPAPIPVATAPSAEMETPSAPVIIPPLPSVDDAEAARLAASLDRDLARDVPAYRHANPAFGARMIALAQDQIAANHTVIDRAQILTVVDRNPHVQRLCFVLARPGAPWIALGGTPVSTGQTGRKTYYITPLGVFQNDVDHLGYRALGTLNEHGIRGIGAKGMRVWDFGWHSAEKGWLPTHERGDIRLELHATDPTFLERRLGHPASEGCVRIPSKLNTFIDRHGLLDVLDEQAARYDPRFAALLPKDRTPSPIAGDLLVVVDSEPGPAATR